MDDGRERNYILIVDDMEESAILLQKVIEKIGYESTWAGSVPEAVKIMGKGLPDLVITDITMPEISGYEFIQMLQKNVLTKEIPIIVASALNTNEDKRRAYEAGVSDYITKPFNVIQMGASIHTHMKMRRMQKELEEYSRKLKITIEQQHKKIESEQKHILVALANVIELMSGDDGANHLANIAYNAQLLAQSLSFSKNYEDYISQDYIETIHVAALLHDIGKISYEGDTLGLGGDAIDMHGERGARILEGIYHECVGNRFLNMAINIARYHNKNYTSDNPEDEIQGEKLPLSSRIVHVVCDYDSFTTGRKKECFSNREEVLQYMKEQSGKKYDPEIIEVFLKVVNQLH